MAPHTATPRRHSQLRSLLCLLPLAAQAANAADIALVADDALGSSSLLAAGNWSNASAPSAANAYSTNDFMLRTPANTTTPVTFAGASLLVNATGNDFAGIYDLNDALMFKGTRTGTMVINIPSLRFDGSFLRHADNEDSICRLATGPITIEAGGMGVHLQGPIYLDAPVHGTGDIHIVGAGTVNALRALYLTSSSNTYAGTIYLRNATQARLNFVSGSVMTFVPGASGVCNRIAGTGGVVSFDGVFRFNLAGAATHGASWTIVDVATLTETFGTNFSVENFADPENDSTWLSADGNYQFSELTGLLTFVGAAVDTDGDGMADDWEVTYLGGLSALPGDDPDGDGYNNLEEFNAGSLPNNVASTPLDTDADGLPDSYELTYFGNLNQTAGGDFDGDGASNSAERLAGSAPNNAESTLLDVDADELPDAWEVSNLGTLATNGGSDPDGDRFGNLQEYLAGTNPADKASRPPGTPVTLVPVWDGDNTTSEYGYGGSSAINSVAFVRSSLKTVGNQQFMTWYGRHRFDGSAAYNNTIWIGRRTLGSSTWEVFRHPTYTANAITDGHDVICFGIDGADYLHMSWGMHGDAFHYARSTTPVTGTGPIQLGADTTMTGLENGVTYPQFLKLPNGDLLYVYREGVSGNGDQFINRYNLAAGTWTNIHTPGGQSPFLKGTGFTPNYNPYINMPQLGGDGDDLILTWCWRYSSGTSDSGSGFSGYQTNTQLNFARSLDAGLTWQRYDGSAYTLPITKAGEAGANTTAEVILAIPEGYSLINQASTCLDAAGNPVTATWWAPDTGTNNYRRQYVVVYRHANGTWQARAVSNRSTDLTTVRYAENHVRDLGRPIVVTDDEDRVIVSYRDNQASNLTNADTSLNTGVSNGLTIVHSLPLAEDPDRSVWIAFDLTDENLGNYEPIIDNELWDRERKLHFLHQPAGGQGYNPPANTASRISVLEWDAADYFKHAPEVRLDRGEAGAIRLTWRTEPSYNYTLSSTSDFITWTTVQTARGNGTDATYSHTPAPGDAPIFWRITRTEQP